jgi:hypothetical protein
MNKLIAIAFLVLAVLLEPALGHASANARPRASEAQKEKPTRLSASDSTCMKYFALIDEVVSVPCGKDDKK